MKEWELCASCVFWIRFRPGKAGGSEGLASCDCKFIPSLCNVNRRVCACTSDSVCETQGKGSGCVVRDFKGANPTFLYLSCLILETGLYLHPPRAPRCFPPFDNINVSQPWKRGGTLSLIRQHEPKAKGHYMSRNLVWVGLRLHCQYLWRSKAHPAHR